jgi:hypothetical protein
MREDLQQIDTSAIEQLVRIKHEQSILRDRLQKMEENRSSVTSVVYQRVRGDYESRLSALDAEAKPLKDHARSEYSKLRTLQLEMERSLEDARLEKEEVEFRNSLGEFEGADFKSRIAECTKIQAERQSHLDDAIGMKARFLTAFNSEDDLNEALSPAPPAPPAPKPAQQAATPPPPPPEPLPSTPDDATAIAFRMPPAAEEHHEVFPTAATDATAVAWFADSPARNAPRTEELPSLNPPSSPFGVEPTAVAPSFAPPADFGSIDATQVAPMSSFVPAALPMPRVISLVGDKQGQEYVLGPGMTFIGRSPKAQIRVLEESVSRQHAQIIVGPDGCKLIDMGSENGTTINGKRVSEHFLADGDLIQIGAQRFLFRS